MVMKALWCVALAASFCLVEVDLVAQNLPIQLKLVTWNVSWLGHPAFPPADDERQLHNVVQVLRTLDADAIALQEIASEEAFREIIRSLGSGFGGILGSSSGDQRLGVVFRTSSFRVFSVTDEVFRSEDDLFGGRPPLVVRAHIGSEGHQSPLTLIVVHLKAFGDATSYERRLRSIEKLKAYLETVLLDLPVIIVGDFNDATTFSTAVDRSSSLRPFLNDPSYEVTTATLERAGAVSYCGTTDCSAGSMLDHIIVRRGSLDWTTSPAVAASLLQDLPDFVSSTSDHLPVQLTLTRAPTLQVQPSIAFGMVYPNPFADELVVEVPSALHTTIVQLVDPLGRLLETRTIDASSTSTTVQMDATLLPGGVYFLVIRAPSGIRALPVARVP